MCGIAGKVWLDNTRRAEPGEISRMIDVMRHRGPDGDGIYVDGPAGLGHLRLSIIDLSTGGQPLANEDDTVWIVFNGEIYNYQELRKELEAKGHTFKTYSDTEVIVHLYEERGADCVRFLRGMFAFAIWDCKRQRLFAARDRVGIKPLYYCETAGEIAFASELKGLLAHPGVSREIDIPAIRQFLSFYYVPGERTLFRSIRKLPPGHWLTVEHGKVSTGQYWDLSFTRDRWEVPFDQAVEELYELLATTVRDHMIADVPVGVLLSGGVDSSAVLNFAVRGTEKKVKTFTVGFDGNQVVDERPYARLAAQKFGTEHFETSITAKDFWDFLPSYVRHMEEPVCEPPAVALYYVSRLARQHVKVLLSGEGGDEAFAGYPNYQHLLRLDRIRSVLGPVSRPAGALAGMLGRWTGNERLTRYGSALGRSLPDYYFSRTSGPTAFFNDPSSRLFSGDFISAANGTSATAMMTAMLNPVRHHGLLEQMLFIDTKTWLPDDLLIKADKMTMANSLELRVPLLDHKVLEFAASLPASYKVSGSEAKRVLKAAFARVLPQEILTRTKAGFPVPYNGWLRNDFAGPVRDILLSGESRRRGYFNTASIERLLDAHQARGLYGKEVFSLLALELWHREFADAANNASQSRAPHSGKITLAGSPASA